MDEKKGLLLKGFRKVCGRGQSCELYLGEDLFYVQSFFFSGATVSRTMFIEAALLSTRTSNCGGVKSGDEFSPVFKGRAVGSFVNNSF